MCPDVTVKLGIVEPDVMREGLCTEAYINTPQRESALNKRDKKTNLDFDQAEVKIA